jgi:hypothetical protein
VFLAAFFDWRPFLNVGERGTIMVIAADRRQARVILRYVKGLLQAVPMLRQLIEAERQEGLDLSNKITIEVHTASFRTVRGYTVVAALLDELAYWPTEDSASPDFEILTALKPAMATIPGAVLLCASSPYARRGALWESYHRYYGQDGPVPILVWQADTRTMNPTVPQAFIDAEYEKDPVSAESEFGAQFRVDLEAFVTREALEGCVEWGAFERGPLGGRNYLGFVDVSGGGADSFALAVAHKEDDIAVLDCLRERRPPLSPEAVIAEFADVLKSYGVTRVTGDRYGGQFPVEQFKKNGISYEPSPDPKGGLYLGLLPLLNSGKVRLLNNKRLLSQLLALERNTARGGKDSIDHAKGGHDDVANAAAGALVLALVRKGFVYINGFRVGSDGKLINHPQPEWRSRDSDGPRPIRTVTLTPEQARAEGVRFVAPNENPLRPKQYRRHW